jgi:hypothetical protein
MNGVPDKKVLFSVGSGKLCAMPRWHGRMSKLALIVIKDYNLFGNYCTFFAFLSQTNHQIYCWIAE